MLPHWINGQYFLNDVSQKKSPKHKEKQTLYETIINTIKLE